MTLTSMSTEMASPPINVSRTGGELVKPPSRPTVIVGSLLLLIGSTSPTTTVETWVQSLCQPALTASGPYWQAPVASDVAGLFRERTPSGVWEVRRLTGLTWEKIADLFGVSRRTIHFWTSGKQMSSEKELHMLRLLDALKPISSDDPGSMSLALLDDASGKPPLLLLAEGNYEEAARLAAESIRRHADLIRTSTTATGDVYRPPPESLMGTMNDQVHRDIGTGRPGRTVRNWRRGHGT